MWWWCENIYVFLKIMLYAKQCHASLTCLHTYLIFYLRHDMIIIFHPYQITNKQLLIDVVVFGLCLNQQKKIISKSTVHKKKSLREYFVALVVTKQVKFGSNALFAVFLFLFLCILCVIVVFSIEGGTYDDQEEEKTEESCIVAIRNWARSIKVIELSHTFIQFESVIYCRMHISYIYVKLISQMPIYIKCRLQINSHLTSRFFVILSFFSSLNVTQWNV